MEEFQKRTKARLDMLREVGGLFQLAQERTRGGKSEVKPGEGKWWTEKRRWGGGPGGEVEKEGLKAEVKEIAKDDNGEIPTAPPRASKLPPSRRRKTPAMLWSELKCGSKLWDPKTEYEAIGKDPDSDWDEVCSLTSITIAATD
jgi:hypothetical protein